MTDIIELAKKCNADLTTFDGEPLSYTFAIANLEKFVELLQSQSEPVSYQRFVEENNIGWIDCRIEDIPHYKSKGQLIRELYTYQLSANEQWVNIKDELPSKWRDDSIISEEVFISYLDGVNRRYGSAKINLRDLTAWEANQRVNPTHWMKIKAITNKKGE